MPDIPTFKGIVLEETVIVSETKWINVIVLPLFPKKRLSFDDTSQGKMAEQGVNGRIEENAGRWTIHSTKARKQQSPALEDCLPRKLFHHD